MFYWNNDKSLSINRHKMRIKDVYLLKVNSLRCLNALFQLSDETSAVNALNLRLNRS